MEKRRGIGAIFNYLLKATQEWRMKNGEDNEEATNTNKMAHYHGLQNCPYFIASKSKLAVRVGAC
jgi:hypothetical protein